MRKNKKVRKVHSVKVETLPVFPEIDIPATGAKLHQLREESGLSVAQLSEFLRLSGTRSIYYWQSGQTLPSVDSLYAMSRLFQVSMNDIIVEKAA